MIMEDESTGQHMEMYDVPPNIIDVNQLRIGIIEPLEKGDEVLGKAHMLLIMDGKAYTLKPRATEAIHAYIINHRKELFS